MKAIYKKTALFALISILLGALKHKYPDFTELPKLDDELETLANTYVLENY